jgi:hypothetical protein
MNRTRRRAKWKTRRKGTRAGGTDPRVELLVLQKARRRAGVDGELEFVPLIEQATCQDPDCPTCTDPAATAAHNDCPTRSVLVRAYWTSEAETEARTYLVKRRNETFKMEFRPKSPVTATAATIKFDPRRMVALDWLQGNAIIDTRKPQSYSTYRSVMKEVAASNADGAWAQGDLTAEVVLWVRPSAFGRTVFLENEREEQVPPEPPEVLTRGGFMRSAGNALAAKAVGLLITIGTGWLIQSVPASGRFFHHLWVFVRHQL